MPHTHIDLRDAYGFPLPPPETDPLCCLDNARIPKSMRYDVRAAIRALKLAERLCENSPDSTKPTLNTKLINAISGLQPSQALFNGYAEHVDPDWLELYSGRYSNAYANLQTLMRARRIIFNN